MGGHCFFKWQAPSSETFVEATKNKRVAIKIDEMPNTSKNIVIPNILKLQQGECI
jgi:hypothetical protein